MKELSTLANNATIKQLQRQILLDTKGQSMKESNFLADNVPMKQLPRIVLLDTKGQYMKVKLLYIFADNATIK